MSFQPRFSRSPVAVLLALLPLLALPAADGLQSNSGYKKMYGETKAPVTVDPAKDLPRYPAVPPKAAIATWQVKAGFHLQLAANEPQVQSPIAISFDESGRMFVCEMIDYSEMRDATPHLGRVSVLEDRDGDGHFETSTIFADDLPWPTGLIWAKGGLYVAATPDIWRFEDRDGDGKAEYREKVFTGFGTGLKMLNVQSMMNSFRWGQDNRIHVLAGGGNRGKVTCLKRPELPGQELGGRDFWFDPLTHEFGLESGGAQYGMSFDNWGRKFGCSNSDHLQFWAYDDAHADRNPFIQLPSPHQSIAADGGAAEVFRISPDEPWRIIRTRWRISGLVPGMVEGGGRVSGYFTGATGTLIYRGDAYGPDFLNNSFTGDAGGQLVHRKTIHPAADGVNLVGERPKDEQNFEFAASRDTWVRVVDFANAPDGCLHVCDMYREVIEHPWSIPEEIKQHLDLNSGRDRGRIYRIVPDNPAWKRRDSRLALGRASVAELAALLEHPNGWHRDTASRLLYERQDAAAVPIVAKLLAESREPLARHHALGVLDGLHALDEQRLLVALGDTDAPVRERALGLTEKWLAQKGPGPRLVERLAALADDPAPRVRLALAFLLGTAVKHPGTEALGPAFERLARRDHAHPWIAPALLSGPPDVTLQHLFGPLTADPAFAKEAAPFIAKLIELRAASQPPADRPALLDFVARGEPNILWLRALAEGLRRANTTLEAADPKQKLGGIFEKAMATVRNSDAKPEARITAIDVLSLSSSAKVLPHLFTCLASGQPDTVQAAAIPILARNSGATVTLNLLANWAGYGTRARESALAALSSRNDRLLELLKAIQAGSIKPTELSASQVQNFTQHKDPRIAELAKTALASVIPPSRAEVAAKFKSAVTMNGDVKRGEKVYQTLCVSCHRAAGQGAEVGPDLITVKSKGREALLTAILEPNKEIAPQYVVYTVNTKDGQEFTGFITEDNATGMTIKMAGGATQHFRRADIKGSSSNGQSLMPEGLENGQEVQAVADLLTFIETLR